jgi:hypothetical protein
MTPNSNVRPRNTRAIMRLLNLILFTAFTCNAHAQDPFADLRTKLEAQRLEADRQRTESIAKLKQAILNLREVRLKSCQFRPGANCHLADLSSIELLLLDIEDSYRLAEIRTPSEERKASYAKIQKVSNDLRDMIDELAQLIDKSEP